MNRRDFQRLAAAAFGGAVIGVGMQSSLSAADAGNPLLSDPHVCRGLNTCKGKGAGKTNACAGQGTCATAEKHTCHGDNACKGQGGCGAHPGENACKGKGSCNVPLTANHLAQGPQAIRATDEGRGKNLRRRPGEVALPFIDRWSTKPNR